MLLPMHTFIVQRSPTSYSSYSSHGVSSYSSGSSSSGVDLHDCLKIFTREEKMEGDEKPVRHAHTHTHESEGYT